MKNIAVLLVLILIHINKMYAQESSIVAGVFDSTTIYYNYEPDSVLPVGPFPIYSSSLDIDLNSDNVVDYEIFNLNATGHFGGQYLVTVTPFNNNEVNYYRIDSVYSSVNDTMFYYQVPKPFEFGEKINDSLLFTTSETCLYRYAWSDLKKGPPHIIDDWKNLDDRYLGIRMSINDTLFYGWIKLEISSGGNQSKVTIMSYAMSQTVETSDIYRISNKQKIKIYPNPVKTDINILLPKSSNYRNISIIDNTGIVCKTQRITNTGLTTMNISSLQNGLYILKISAEDDIFYSRIIKQ